MALSSAHISSIMSVVRPARPLISTVILVLLAASCTLASDRDVPEIERRASALNKTIMCPVCPGESIDQSQNPLARQMRGVVREKLAEGWSETQIKGFLVERYGPSVLLEPPTTGFSLAAWIVPPVAFALALAALLLTLKWMRMSAAEDDRSDGSGADDHQALVGRIDNAIRGGALPDEPHTVSEQPPSPSVGERPGAGDSSDDNSNRPICRSGASEQ